MSSLGVPGDQLLALTHVAGCAVVALLAWTATRDLTADCPPVSPKGSALFLAGVLVALALLQWPFVISRNVFNPDESQAIAQALRYLDHPIPWRDVDGHTTGPLNSWILSLALLAGAEPSMMMARTIRVLIVFSSLLLLHLGFREASPGRARLMVLPIAAFFALSFEPDFVHYSSELVSILLLSGATFAMAPGFARSAPSPVRCLASGVLLGAVPFAKLQAAPLAGLLWLVHLVICLDRDAAPARRRGPSVAALVAGALLPSLAILGLVAFHGAWGDFYTSYVSHNIAYMSNEGPGFQDQLRSLTATTSFVVFCLTVLLALIPLVMQSLRALRGGDSRVGRFALGGVVWFVACVFVVLAPGWAVVHYQLLLVAGMTIALMFLAGPASSSNAPPPALHSPTARVMILVLFALLLVPAAMQNRDAASAALGDGSSPATRLAESVSRYVSQGEEISVWGWLPSLYVESNCPPATREAHGHFLIEPGELQPYYLNRHLRDLQVAMPPVFVDVAVPGAFLWQTWPDDSRHETFPAIASFVASHYALAETLPADDPARPFRVYVRRDRLAEIGIEFDDAEPLE